MMNERKRDDLINREDDEPEKKIMKIDTQKQKTLANKTQISAILHSEVFQGLRAMYESHFYALCALELKNINGSEGYGVSFSSAFCSTDIMPEYYPMGSIFANGMRILLSFLQKPNDVLSEKNMAMCTKLLNFLADTDSLAFMQNLVGSFKKDADLDTKTQVSVALAEHLLKKLSLNENYVLDSRRTNDDFECRCGCNHNISDRFKDTSIGNKSVWHGYLDILLGKEVPVFVPDTEEVSPDDATPDEVIFKSLSENSTKHQLIAQTIVFSFFEKKRHPRGSHFLIPSIGISPTDVVFYFYDAELDILLQSAQMPFYTGQSISYGTLIAVWLVINYKHLGTGLTGSLRDLPKSKFFTLSSKMIDVYKNDLGFGNVGHSYGNKEFHPSLVTCSNFHFPSGVEQLDLDNV